MGTTINISMLNMGMLQKSTTPIILCSFPNRIAKLLETGKYIPLNLNIKLAEALLKIPQSQRNLKANDELMKIISQCHEPAFLEDYEILFDPRYDINAIKVFIEISRHQKVVVRWRGRMNGNSLEYASPEYSDYHSFRIQDYDITCVISGGYSI